MLHGRESPRAEFWRRPAARLKAVSGNMERRKSSIDAVVRIPYEPLDFALDHLLLTCNNSEIGHVKEEVCFARIKSTFEMNNIQRWDVTFLHSLLAGEITIRQARYLKVRTELLESVSGATWSPDSACPRREISLPLLVSLYAWFSFCLLFMSVSVCA
jgi:hypothetical protein